MRSHPWARTWSRFLLSTVLIGTAWPVLGTERCVPAAPEMPLADTMTTARIEVGRKLFFDRRFSSDGRISCSDCHQPDRAFTDGRERSLGVDDLVGMRNTPTLLNVGYYGTLFWDGRSDSLEDQARYPVTHPKEMNMRRLEVVRLVSEDSEYRAAFSRAFAEQAISFDLVSIALAAFQRTLVAWASPFDHFYFCDQRDALSDSAQRGWQLFQGKGDCISCHRFDDDHLYFTDFGMHNTGIGWDTEAVPDLGRYLVTRDKLDRGRFRTPTLRQIAQTAPYMHDGRFSTLAEVLEHYAGGGYPNRYLDSQLGKIKLSVQDRIDLVAFLESLSGVLTTAPNGVAGTESGVEP